MFYFEFSDKWMFILGSMTLGEWQIAATIVFLPRELSQIRSPLFDETWIAGGIFKHPRRKSIDKLTHGSRMHLAELIVSSILLS